MDNNTLNIRSQALCILAEGSRKYFLAYISLPIVTTAVFWTKVAAWLSLAWLSASLAVVVFRYFLVNAINPKKLDKDKVIHIEKMAVLSSLLSGVLWGAAAFIFFNTESVASQIYLLGTIFGITSTALILCAWLPATYYAFVIPVLTAVFIRFLSESGAHYNGYAILTLVYFVVVMGVIRSQSKLAQDSLSLRFENLELLEKIQQEKEIAVKANEAKTKFLAAASHDLRQPMHSIGLFSAALQNHTSNPDALRLINYINHSVSSLDNLLSVLMDISRLDAGVISPRLAHISLNTLLERVSNEYEVQARAKQLHWRVKHRDKLVVYSDGVLLETILRNLVSNAIRYTSNGSVEISALRDGDSIKILIKDTGVGIPAESQETVFDEFFQLPREDVDGNAGVGLGLAIVKRIMGILDYQLSIESKPGQGTTFTFGVPLGESEKIEAAENLSEKNFDGTGISVLVIDEDETILQGMEELLKSWSYNVLTARSGAEALAAVTAGKITPVIVIADYRLAEAQTGIDVVIKLQKLVSSPFEVIVVTGESTEQEIRDLYSSAYKLLHKPVKPAALRAHLRSATKVKVAEV